MPPCPASGTQWQCESWAGCEVGLTSTLSCVPHPPRRRPVPTEQRDQGVHRDLATPLRPRQGRRNPTVWGGRSTKEGVKPPHHPCPQCKPEAATWAVSPQSQRHLRQARRFLWRTRTPTAQGAQEGVRTLPPTRGRGWEKSLTPDGEGKSRLTYSSSVSQTEKPRPREGRKHCPRSQRASSLARVRNPLPSFPSLSPGLDHWSSSGEVLNED